MDKTIQSKSRDCQTGLKKGSKYMLSTGDTGYWQNYK